MLSIIVTIIVPFVVLYAFFGGVTDDQLRDDRFKREQERRRRLKSARYPEEFL